MRHQIEQPLSTEQIQSLPNGQYAIGGVTGLYVYKNGVIKGYYLQAIFKGKKYRQDYPSDMPLDDVREQANIDRLKFRNTIRANVFNQQIEEEYQPQEKTAKKAEPEPVKAKATVKAVKPKTVKIDCDFKLEPTEPHTPCVEEIHLFSEIEILLLISILKEKQNQLGKSVNDQLYSNVLEGLIEKIRNMPAIKVAKDKPCN